jgi:hypothetical protein
MPRRSTLHLRNPFNDSFEEETTMSFRQNQNLYDLSEHVSAEDIFVIAGNWSSRETTVEGTQITTYGRVLGSHSHFFESIRNIETGVESPLLLPAAPGSPLEPIHKSTFIRDFIFGGDEMQALAWVKTIISPSYSWLKDLGFTAKTFDGESLPEFEEDGLLSELAADEFLRLKAREMAKVKLAEEAYREEGETPSPIMLRDWLEEPDTEEQYRIDQLWTKNGTTFVVAPNKSGKTTMMLNVARVLADGGLFLGRYETRPVSRNLGIVNFELTDNQFKRWVRKLGITNLEGVKVWNLKGQPNPFRSNTSRKHFAAQLKAEDIEILIVDPFSSAYTGEDANQNEVVKQFLKSIDEMIFKGGVEEFMMVVHAGHDGKRARGASTLADHPDATWFIGKPEYGTQRTFRAEGRDVYVEEEGIKLEDDGITLTLTGVPAAELAALLVRMKIKTFVSESPNCKAGEIEAHVGGNKTTAIAARNALVAAGVLVETVKGNSKTYALAP